jgi:DNA-binding MarR family transcriptional regulator
MAGGTPQNRVERLFEEGRALHSQDSVRRLCDRIWDELFESIDAAKCLKRREKRVLCYLWGRCSTRSVSSPSYPGHECAAGELNLSAERIKSTLSALERKGFIKRIERNSYRLNALLLESAFDKARSA